MSGKPFVINEIDVQVGRMMQIMRTKMGMSQKDLAKITGVTFQQIQKYETASNRIFASRLYEIARAMELPIGRFFGEMDKGETYDAQMVKIIKQIYKLSPTDKKLILQLINRLSE